MNWLKQLFLRRRLYDDLDKEIALHLEERIEELVASGMSLKEAISAARREFGSVELVKENARETWGWRWLEDLLGDLRFGVRMLRRNPGFAAIVVLTLALGIGANTTIFSVVSAFLLRKPPVRDPDRVMIVSSVDPAKDTYAPDRAPVSPLDYLDWRAQSAAFENMGAANLDDFTISGGGAPQRAAGARVSAEFFHVLGVNPLLGRVILPEENRSGNDRVVVLSEELWKERFGNDRQVLGQSIKINGNRYKIVGIMPSTFQLWDFHAQLWIPLAFSPDDLLPSARSRRFLRVFARLKPGIDERHATAEMQTVTQRIAETHKDTNQGWGASVASLQLYGIADSGAKTATLFLSAAVGFVLLIACTNLASLMLARTSAREREFSVRSTLGAGRFRLVRQLLTECLLLSMAGAGLGILGAFWGVRALRSQFSWNEDALAMGRELSVDSHVLVFTLVVSVCAGIFFGLAPAIQIARREPGGALKEVSRGTTAGRERHRFQRMLVAGQLALSLFLLVGAAIFVDNFLEEIRASAGFNSHNLLTASVSLRGLEYLQPQRQRQFFEDVLKRLQGLPGVQSAALTTDLPFNFPGSARFTIEGHPVAKPEEQPFSGYFAVSPGYFATTQIPLLRGREFASSDTADAPPVVIVNEEFAKHFLGTEDPLGRHIHLVWHKQDQWSEIVGVVGNVREFLSQPAPRPELFVPYTANPSGLTRLLVRTRTKPESFSDSLRAAVWAVDPDQAVIEMRTMERVIADSATGDDLMADLMSGFALLALVVAGVGLFGLLSYLVGQRKKEMGIRLALGAQPGQVLRLVIRNGMALVGAGVGVGFLASLALPKLVAAAFDGMRFNSAWILISAPVTVILVGVAACYVPAKRATRVDPMVALRYE